MDQRNIQYICHRKSSLAGTKRKNHKYVARVLVKSGSNGNKYKYFYDMDSYNAYLKSPNTTGESKTSANENSDSILSKFKSIVSVKRVKDNISKGRDAISKLTDKTIDSVKKSASKVDDRLSSDKIKKKLSKTTKELSKEIKKGKDKVDEILDKATDKITGKNDTRKDTIKDKESKIHKYKHKVKLPNGKYRYFYSDDEYENYQERLEYQKNEPGFMKKVKDISHNDIFTAFEDQEKVNEEYDPYDDETSRNCSNCSAAYELRRRGYDVEANKNTGDSYNGRADRLYDYFENAEILMVYGDGNTHTANKDFMHKWCDKDLGIFDRFKYEEEYEYYSEDGKQKYSAKSIEKAIKANNPPGSRGMIDVDWTAGSAHSIVYEVDKSGKVTIRDSQTYDEYGLDELADRVSRVRICRTDNLQLKEGILGAVTTNTDKKREYYVNKRVAYSYDG